MSISKDSVSLEILEEQIKIARNRMQKLWDEKGHTDDEVLAASIEVDRLMNEYDQVNGFLMQERKECLTRAAGKVNCQALPPLE